MSDRLIDTTIAVLGAAAILACAALMVREAMRPPPPCADYAAEPGVPCRAARSLVVEGGVALCRCPGATP